MEHWDIVLKWGELGVLAMVIVVTSRDQVKALNKLTRVVYRIAGKLGVRTDSDVIERE